VRYDFAQSNGLAARGFLIERDAAWSLSRGAAGMQNLKDFAIGHALQHMRLKQSYRQIRHIG
jgi:hypothetical protein